MNVPPPAPFTSAHGLPGKRPIPSSSQWNGLHVPGVTQALPSPRRLRARRVSLPLLGALPQAAGDTADRAHPGQQLRDPLVRVKCENAPQSEYLPTLLHGRDLTITDGKSCFFKLKGGFKKKERKYKQKKK